MTNALTKPSQVTLALQLLWGSVGLGVFEFLFRWPNIDNAAPLSFVLVVAIATTALVSWLIVMIGRGRNWARIVYLVVFLLGVPLIAFGLTEELTRRPVIGLINLAQMALQAVALVLLFRPPGSSWFRPNPQGLDHPG